MHPSNTTRIGAPLRGSPFLLLLFFFSFLAPCLSLSASINVDFTAGTSKFTSKKMFGTVDTNLIPSTNNGPYLMGLMAGLDLEFIRVVDPTSALAWTDPVNVWNTNAVNAYFSSLKTAYAGKPWPEFIITIKKWPTWMYSGTVLPYSLHGDYSRMCAQLVKIINIDLGLNATYWQPWNNIDPDYINYGNITQLFDLYEQSAVAMKAVDPSIKVGPSFGNVNSDFYIQLMDLSLNVDFIELHFYLTPDLSTRTTEQIFLQGAVSQRYHDFVDPIRAAYPERNLNVILDEYALHYNSQFVDPRVSTNIAAVWFATMHAFFAQEMVEGANNYNVRSNYIGLFDNTNSERPSASIFRWSNKYFVGEICGSTTTYGSLLPLAVRNGNVSALYLINFANTNITFTFQNITGYNDSYALVRNTVNSTGVFENEAILEFQGASTFGTHTIPAYAVWVLYYDSSNPVHVAGSIATLQLKVAVPSAAAFNETAFVDAVAAAVGVDARYIVVLRVDDASRKRADVVLITFEITAHKDAELIQALTNLNNSLASFNNAFTQAGFNVDATSLNILSVNLQDPTSEEVTPDGYTCYRDQNGARICTRNYVPHEFSEGLAGGLGALVGVGVIVAVFASVVLIINTKSLAKKYGAFYCGVIIAGTVVAYAAALTLLPEPTDSLCLAFPWLIGIGFVLVYGCLFIKAGVLYQVWRHSMQLKRTSITPFTVIKIVGIALFIEVIFLIIWSVVDPPTVHMVEMVDHTLQPHCHSDEPTFWIVFLVVKGCWLMFGAVISVLTRDVIKEHNDFSAIAYAIYNNVILIAIAIPLAIILETVPNGTMLIAVIVIVLAFMFTTIILFFETWQKLFCPNKFKLPTTATSTSVRGTSATMQSSVQASSKESAHSS